MWLVRATQSIGYVIAGTLGLVAILFAHAVLTGSPASTAFAGLLLVVGYGLLLFGLQAVVLMALAMWLLETRIRPVCRWQAVLAATGLAACAGLLAPVVPFGLSFFSALGALAGAVGGLLYGCCVGLGPAASDDRSTSTP